MTAHPNHSLAARVGDAIDATRRQLATLLELQRDLVLPTSPTVELACGGVAAIEAVARSLGSTYHEVIGGRKYAGAARARQAASLALWRLGLNYTAIGKELRQAGHRSALENVSRAGAIEQTSPAFARAVAAGVNAGLTTKQATRGRNKPRRSAGDDGTVMQ
mgnify:FL=1